MNSSNNVRMPKPQQINSKQSEWGYQLERCRLHAQNPMIKNFSQLQYFPEIHQNKHIQSQA